VVGSARVFVNLPPTFTLTGLILEAGPGARSITGARVQILEAGHTFSDEQGAFSLPGTPRGRTIIEVSKAGYRTWSNVIVVDHDAEFTISLSPANTVAQ
jgi:hypothetical protein